MGNPLVNELVIPTNMKDKWNATDAEEEARVRFLLLQLGTGDCIESRCFGPTSQRRIREDLINALLRYSPGPPVCGGGKTNETLADFVRVDLNVPPTAADSQRRLGPSRS